MVWAVLLGSVAIQLFILSATLYDMRNHLKLSLFHVPREKWQ
jgi:hypothetical protein